MNFLWLLVAILVAILLIWLVNGNSFSMGSTSVSTTGFFRQAPISAPQSSCATGKCGMKVLSPALSAPPILEAQAQVATNANLKKKSSARRSW